MHFMYDKRFASRCPPPLKLFTVCKYLGMLNYSDQVKHKSRRDCFFLRKNHLLSKAKGKIILHRAIGWGRMELSPSENQMLCALVQNIRTF